MKMSDKWSASVEITKTDEEQHLVFGWLSVVNKSDGEPIVDLHGDMIDLGSLEKAVYKFVLESRVAGEMHRKFEGIGRLVESVMLTPEKKNAIGIPKGSTPDGWWVGFKIDNVDTWAAIKSGEFRMFSIGGMARRKPLKEGEDA
jgi:hypothetical protein